MFKMSFFFGTPCIYIELMRALILKAVQLLNQITKDVQSNLFIHIGTY